MPKKTSGLIVSIIVDELAPSSLLLIGCETDTNKASSIIWPRPLHSAGAVSWCCRSSGSHHISAHACSGDDVDDWWRRGPSPTLTYKKTALRYQTAKCVLMIGLRYWNSIRVINGYLYLMGLLGVDWFKHGQHCLLFASSVLYSLGLILT